MNDKCQLKEENKRCQNTLKDKHDKSLSKLSNKIAKKMQKRNESWGIKKI